MVNATIEGAILHNDDPHLAPLPAVRQVQVQQSEQKKPVDWKAAIAELKAAENQRKEDARKKDAAKAEAELVWRRGGRWQRDTVMGPRGRRVSGGQRVTGVGPSGEWRSSGQCGTGVGPLGGGVRWTVGWWSEAPWGCQVHSRVLE